MGGNRGREQGGFLLGGLLAGVWGEMTDRHTGRKRGRESSDQATGRKRRTEGGVRTFGGVWRRRERRGGRHVSRLPGNCIH